MLNWRAHLQRLMSLLTRGRERRVLAKWSLDHDALGRHLRTAAYEIDPLLAAYGREVSSPDMAVSLQCAALLAALCAVTRPRRVLDSGSGFSSWVLRRFAGRHRDDAVVWSVDDNRQWLDATRRYLESQGSAGGPLLAWEDFARSGEADFDLIFHDLGQAREIRGAVLADVCRRLGSGGLLLLDDFHKPDYRRRARKVLAGAGFEVVELRHHTLDGYGRYAALARRAA